MSPNLPSHEARRGRSRRSHGWQETIGPLPERVAPEKEDEETVGRTVFRTMGQSFRLSDMISLARRWSCLMSVLRVLRPRAKSDPI